MNEYVISRIRWRSVTAIVMVAVGCACFILSCVAAMVITGKD